MSDHDTAAGSQWTVTYWRYGAEYTEDFDTLEDAVRFDVRGVDNQTHAVARIDGPGGVVLEGEAREEATMRYEAPEKYGSLADMELPRSSS